MQSCTLNQANKHARPERRRLEPGVEQSGEAHVKRRKLFGDAWDGGVQARQERLPFDTHHLQATSNQ